VEPIATEDHGLEASSAVARARELFLADEGGYGCAETTFIVLKEAFGLSDAADPGAAMALNGGVAWHGGTCGAVTGAALAVGQASLAGSPDPETAKRDARRVVAGLIDDFEAEFGAFDCRTLIGRDISTPERHAAFIADGGWRTSCTRQIEFAVGRLAGRSDRA